MQALVEEQKRVDAHSKMMDTMHELVEGMTTEGICQRLEHLQFEKGQDIFAVQWTDLFRMARTGDIRGIRYFLEDMKINPNIQDDRGDTALNIAAATGQHMAAAELVKRGADTMLKNNKGWTPAHSAATHDDREMILLLAESGADLRLPDITGATSAHLAASANGSNAIQAIHECCKEKGAEALSAHAHNGATPAHVAANFDNMEVLRTLHSLGVDFDAQDKMGDTPAHKAARGNHVTTLSFLQAVQADMNIPNDEDDTPADLIMQGGRFAR